MYHQSTQENFRYAAPTRFHNRILFLQTTIFLVCSTFSNTTLSSAYIYLNEILIYVMIRATP